MSEEKKIEQITLRDILSDWPEELQDFPIGINRYNDQFIPIKEVSIRSDTRGNFRILLHEKNIKEDNND